ncbi:MAG: hypothetical protein QW734_06505 [Candidatus Bathyarchaeia archaeon]
MFIETAKAVFNEIKEIYKSTGSPIPLYLVYDRCRKKYGLSIFVIKNCLKWLMKHGHIKWEGEGKLVPLES